MKTPEHFETLPADIRDEIALKDSVVIYRSWYEEWRELLEPEQFVELLGVLLDYYPSGCVMQRTGDKVVDIAAAGCKYEMDRNLKSWLAKKQNGKKGGRPKKSGGDATA